MKRLGKYDIVDKIGVGGFGVVYKGYDPFIKRHVAIKTCSAEDRETRDRFLREAEIAGNLQHRNIVTVFEFGFQDETPYLVQEFLSGEDLDHKIRRADAISVAEKISWLAEIARGLAFAHERGVVHRDIKPANIRILDDGSAKILDFGIAKLAQVHSTLTQAGVTLGTASFLAPEQIRGEALDPRTDVFAFGVLAYELLTYERPFRAQEISALFYKLLNEQPAAIGSRSPGVPDELSRVVMRCLEKDPAQRWFPTSELVAALERLDRRAASGAHGGAPSTASADSAAADSRTERLAPRRAEPIDEATLALSNIELHGRDPGLPVSRALSSAAFGRGRSLGQWAAGLGAVAALAIGIVYFARGGLSPRAPSDLPTAAPGAARPATLAGAAAPPALVPARPTGTPLPPAEAERRPPPAASGGPAPPATQAPPPPPPLVEAPAPPPEPKRAVLVIGPAWDPGMMVRVGNRSLRLDREHRIEVAAGALTLEFSLAIPGYSIERQLPLQLRPGASERVSIPIEKPGRLTVQPHLNTRPGTARLDGDLAGTTPLRGLLLSPGEHFLEVFAAGESAPAIARSVTIASDVETVVTFDLDGRVETIVRDKPLAAP